MRSNLKVRKIWSQTTFILLIVTLVGFYSKFYSGPARDWVNNYLGGVFYEIFWCLVIFLLFRRIRHWVVAVSVFLATSLLEFLQLNHTPVLEFIRRFFIGRVIIGTSFCWLDFPYYLAGSTIGCLLMNYLQKESRKVYER